VIRRETMKLKLRKKYLLILVLFVLSNSLIGGCSKGYENNDTVKLAFLF